MQWVDRSRIKANDYNPNRVSPRELALLKLSILEDMYTQPIVTVRDGDNFVIVDGFHRYFVGGDPDIQKFTGGKLPIVVIDKPVASRMASTVRHNRARGKHRIQGMSEIVYGMLKEGKSDAEICTALGMSPEEIIRLKHITGYAKLFKDARYSEEYIAGDG